MDRSKRSTLRTIFLGMSSGVFLSLTDKGLSFELSASFNKSNIELPSSSADVDFDHFYSFSCLVCRKQELDHETAEKLYALFEIEPWGREHLFGSYLKINGFLSELRAGKSFSDIDRIDFTEGELWFISHVMTTWYLGIYYHESIENPVRVSFEKSLMWLAVEDFVTPPGFAEKPYGHWSALPNSTLEPAD